MVAGNLQAIFELALAVDFLMIFLTEKLVLWFKNWCYGHRKIGQNAGHGNWTSIF